MITLSKIFPPGTDIEELGRPSIFELIREGFDTDKDIHITQDFLTGEFIIVQYFQDGEELKPLTKRALGLI